MATIPVAIFRLLGRAPALSIVLMVLTTVIIVAKDRYRIGGLGDF